MTPEKMGIEARYPELAREMRWFLGGFPIAIIVGYLLGIHFDGFWTLSAFFGVGWIGCLFSAAITYLQRQGYSAALDDVAWLRMAEQGRDGKLPPIIQTGFDAELAKIERRK